MINPAKAVEIPNIGRVRPEDILRFVPTSTGTTTSGTFQMHFDGSDVSLTAKAEALDALAIDPSGRLIISTKGNALLKGVSQAIKDKNQDLLQFTFATTGDSTSGGWAFWFDGSDVGLQKENVDSLWIDPLNGDIYLSVVNNFNVGGVSGNGGTIFVCDPGSLGDTTTCSYRPYWDATAAGLSGNVTSLFIQR